MVEFLFSALDPARQAAASLESEGHEILALAQERDAVRVRVRKVARRARE